jgi:hypothetical protein
MSSILREKKPQRISNEWQFAKEFAAKFKVPNLVLQQMDAMGKLTCRDCSGFGHSLKKCPTGRKLDAARVVTQLCRSVISRYRAESAHRISDPSAKVPTWPLVDSLKRDL